MSDRGHAEIKDTSDTSHHDHPQATHPRRSSHLDAKTKLIVYVAPHNPQRGYRLTENISVMLMPNWQILYEGFRVMN